MSTRTFKIVSMTKAHIRTCTAVVAVSEPWKTLRERIDFARYIDLKQAYACIAGEEPVGFVIFTAEPVFARGGYLRAIGVAPTMRNQGIGKDLLAFAEKATARCAPNLYLCVSSFNQQALAFYRNQGYAKIGKIPDLVLVGTSEYIYRKQLKISRNRRRA